MKSIWGRIRFWNARRKVRDYPRKIRKVWAEHGAETYNDSRILELKDRIQDCKRDLRALFTPYNDKYCAACDGGCCYVIYGGYTMAEYAVMDLQARKKVNRWIGKTNEEIDRHWKENRCFYLGEKIGEKTGCKLDPSLRSLLCDMYICPIFKNVLRNTDREKIDQIIKHLHTYRSELLNRVNEIRKESGMREFDIRILDEEVRKDVEKPI